MISGLVKYFLLISVNILLTLIKSVHILYTTLTETARNKTMFNSSEIYTLTLASGEVRTTRNVFAAVQAHELTEGSTLQKRVDSEDPVLGCVYTYQDGGWA